MSLATSLISDVGVYNVEILISLTDYPGIQTIAKNFDVTITCQV